MFDDLLDRLDDFKIGDRVGFHHWGNLGFIVGTIKHYEPESSWVVIVADNPVDDIIEFNVGYTKLVSEELLNSPLYKAMEEND